MPTGSAIGGVIAHVRVRHSTVLILAHPTNGRGKDFNPFSAPVAWESLDNWLVTVEEYNEVNRAAQCATE